MGDYYRGYKLLKYIYIYGLYGDNGKANGNYYNELYRVESKLLKRGFYRD